MYDTVVKTLGAGLKSSLNQQMTRWAVQFAQPVLYTLPVGDGSEFTVKNGTGTFVKLGDRYTGVTCHHVISQFRTDRSAHGGATFYFGRARIDLDSSIIHENAKLDLVTIDLTEHVGPNRPFSQANFVQPATWPPSAVGAEDVIAFAGFPGVWRRRVSWTHFQFYYLSHGATSVESTASDRFYSKLALEECIGSMREGFEVTGIGGLSGGPVFVWRPDPILRAELAGFITEYQENLDLLHIRTACCISENGRIQEPEAHAGA